MPPSRHVRGRSPGEGEDSTSIRNTDLDTLVAGLSAKGRIGGGKINSNTEQVVETPRSIEDDDEFLAMERELDIAQRTPLATYEAAPFGTPLSTLSGSGYARADRQAEQDEIDEFERLEAELALASARGPRKEVVPVISSKPVVKSARSTPTTTPRSLKRPALVKKAVVVEQIEEKEREKEKQQQQQLQLQLQQQQQPSPSMFTPKRNPEQQQQQQPPQDAKVSSPPTLFAFGSREPSPGSHEASPVPAVVAPPVTTKRNYDTCRSITIPKNIVLGGPKLGGVGSLTGVKPVRATPPPQAIRFTSLKSDEKKQLESVLAEETEAQRKKAHQQPQRQDAPTRREEEPSLVKPATRTVSPEHKTRPEGPGADSMRTGRSAVKESSLESVVVLSPALNRRSRSPSAGDEDVAYLDYIERLVQSLQQNGTGGDEWSELLGRDATAGKEDAYGRIVNHILPGLKKEAEMLDLTQQQRTELRKQFQVLSESLGAAGAQSFEQDPEESWLLSRPSSTSSVSQHSRTVPVSKPVLRRLQANSPAPDRSIASNASTYSKGSKVSGPIKSLEAKIECQDRKLQRQTQNVKRLQQENSELSIRLRVLSSSRSRSSHAPRSTSPTPFFQHSAVTARLVSSDKREREPREPRPAQTDPPREKYFSNILANSKAIHRPKPFVREGRTSPRPRVPLSRTVPGAFSTAITQGDTPGRFGARSPTNRV
eukprot:TRINITY_DN4250_c1_g4_i2.p1 TRINITY_DN4250_c1_g4~~TRINITY_DN4250_c1_g4_i2.p1  ORF type:complete len:711 (+),score=137.34 TRINITY_DN4250_c1_g4_i2:62-2194(+)